VTSTMRRRSPLLAALITYGLLFVVLSIDIIVRVWNWRFRFESPLDVLALFYFEGTRTLITLAGLGVATLALARARRQPVLLWFGLGVAFATIAYTKAAGFDAFPGAMQHHIASALRSADVPQWLLLVLFAHPEWAMWLAVPPLLAYASRYPRQLDPGDVTREEKGARAGAMRSVALVGSDVGGMARSAAAKLLRRGWLEGPRLWLLGAVPAALHTAALLSGTTRTDAITNAVSMVVFALAVALFVTLLRANRLRSDLDEAVPFRWLWRGGVTALALFALSAIAGTLLPGNIVSVAAFTMAPAALAAACLIAVVSTPPLESGVPASVNPGGPRPAPARDMA
jgi:hypothetical protein